jgi:hypothetical protein
MGSWPISLQGKSKFWKRSRDAGNLDVIRSLHTKTNSLSPKPNL